MGLCFEEYLQGRFKTKKIDYFLFIFSLYFIILDAAVTEDDTRTPDFTATSTLVTPEKNARKRKNMEGMNDFDDSGNVDVKKRKRMTL